MGFYGDSEYKGSTMTSNGIEDAAESSTACDRCKIVLLSSLCVLFSLLGAGSSLAALVIQSTEPVTIAIKGFDGLSENTLFVGSLSSGIKHTIDTPYRGLVLLVFEKGQQYPLILGEDLFTLKIISPDKLPSFEGSRENELFYELLKGDETDPGKYDFARLMMQAKQLLDSSHSIRTVTELTALKVKFHTFVGTHYQNLQHSDMLMRLIGQYFMMHEYIDFHVEGAPASDIQVQYKKAVISGVANWLKILKTHIPEHEILNYCVSLYYNRSMVSLAHLIVASFKESAYCPGDGGYPNSFPDDLPVVDANGNRKRMLSEFGNDTVIAFVSKDCPVSMTETVVKARRLAAEKKNVQLIVVPLQQLSDKHKAMRRMVADENMFFINEENWRKKHLPKDIRLPLFVSLSSFKHVKEVNNTK